MNDMDAIGFSDGRTCPSAWSRPLTRPQKSLDASTEVAGRVQSELRLRPAFAVDALGTLKKRVQTRLHCVHQIFGRVQGGGELMCNRYCMYR